MTIVPSISLLALSPHRRLLINGESDHAALRDAFARSNAHGLIALAALRDAGASLPADAAFWREFARTFLGTLAHLPADDDAPIAAPLPPALDATLALRIPAMRGAEYATPDLFVALWDELNALARDEAQHAGGLRQWLGAVYPALHLVGRVTLHLAENKRSADAPFAFMATYTHRLSASDKPVHLPLARALQDYAGAKNQPALRSLLAPLQTAAEQSDWMRNMLDSRRIFQPQAWAPAQAFAFLRETPALEQCGIITRIPNWWRNGKGPRPQVSVRVGEKRATGVGADALLDFAIETTLEGQTLTEAEWQALMQSRDGLVSLRGQWVEVDRDKLDRVMDHWRRVQRGEFGEGVSFLEAMRMLSGVRLDGADAPASDAPVADWSAVVAGGWLREALDHLRNPDAAFDPNAGLRATLRPYQSAGVKWLWTLQHLGLGACLADDMGLGKTIQVIALLMQLKRETPMQKRNASLLVAPASLLANWKSELAKFAPDLRAVILHPSETSAGEWRDAESAEALLAGVDLAITTYGQATRLGWLQTRAWRLVVLDEAQAIKNAGTKQTRAVKQLKAQARIALSGTPVENRLGDLWSLYDFLNPGLLGNATEFGRYVKRLQSTEPVDFAPLRQLVKPWLLRRLKTDRTIIADLPDKTEVTAWCNLSKKQAALYAESAGELARRLQQTGDAGEGDAGIERRGVVLAFLMRFKQICNHPSHWQGDGAFDPADSGKFARLAELCEEIASRGEKALIFTQFREMTDPLAEFLRGVWGRPGLVLHGSVAVKERQQRVSEFQRDDGPPFFVLSLKAGGTGLNLTAASHVIHFDRWWNPAVENQATDRAFRIGQKRNVLVQKFVCRGTLEERIDAMINEKRALAESVLGADGGPEKLLTEMSNAELLQFVSLDLRMAAGE